MNSEGSITALESYYNRDDEYIKSNFLISAKYKSTLLEARLLAMALNKVSCDDVVIDKEGSIIVNMKAAEIKNKLKSNSGSLYARLDAAAKRMINRSIGITDPINQRFVYINVITTVKYENGTFTIIFNKGLNHFIKNIEKNFSVFSLSMMLSFDSIYTFRIYELLRQKAFTPKGVADTGKYQITMDINELLLSLGVVNSEFESVKAILLSGDRPNYELAVEKSPEKAKSFQTWYEVRRHCIDVAQKEINEKSDIYFEYEMKKHGQGGKVYAITFYVTKKPNMQDISVEVLTEKEAELSKAEHDNLLLRVIRLIPEVDFKSAEALLKESNYNLDIIEEKYRYATSVIDHIDNMVGWMIAAIKNDYQQPVTRRRTPKKPEAGAYTDENGKEYSYADLAAMWAKEGIH